jgi:hypothetical protein
MTSEYIPDFNIVSGFQTQPSSKSGIVIDHGAGWYTLKAVFNGMSMVALSLSASFTTTIPNAPVDNNVPALGGVAISNFANSVIVTPVITAPNNDLITVSFPSLLSLGSGKIVMIEYTWKQYV